MAKFSFLAKKDNEAPDTPTSTSTSSSLGDNNNIDNKANKARSLGDNINARSNNKSSNKSKSKSKADVRAAMSKEANFDNDNDNPAKPSSSSSSSSRSGKALQCASIAILLGAAGYLIWRYGLDKPTNWSDTRSGMSNLLDKGKEKWNELDLANFTNVLDGLEGISFGDLFEDDPRAGDAEVLKWKDEFVEYDSGGLHLTLLNALDDTWQSEFEHAIEDWSESAALVLEARRVDVDHTCARVDGAMVVCNANFGATGWVGINENSILRGVIVSSVAKMNEYYLRNADFDHRRFTMCHEVGHGFGLPHTDENPYNKNLGNCLDYTDDPSENLLPGEVNMEKLRNMYLTRRTRRAEEDGTVVESTHLIRRGDRHLWEKNLNDIDDEKEKMDQGVEQSVEAYESKAGGEGRGGEKKIRGATSTARTVGE